jgi:hypothetical protein
MIENQIPRNIYKYKRLYYILISFVFNINYLNRNTGGVSFSSKLTHDRPSPKGILRFGELLTAHEAGVSSVTEKILQSLHHD